MLAFLSKWVAASLAMPILVIMIGKHLNQNFVLTFWPGSIVLMSLGSGGRSTEDVIYVWAIGIGLNILLYLLVGATVYFILGLFRLKN